MSVPAAGTTIDAFAALDLRVGRVARAEPFPEARKPSIRLWIDFGPLGLRTSSAQLTARYTPAALVGRQVVAVVNLPPRRVAGFASEVLVLGAVEADGAVVLLKPDQDVTEGTPIA
ncbi:MAG: tRNA-binding protein [Gemmatimonadales bacterium]|nr:tRNA-binding protein [Gemmatimonadales bacterium]